MSTKVSLVSNKDCFTLAQLFAKAAGHKGLKLSESSSRVYSEVIKTYVLDEKLLSMLAEQGIKQQARPDCNHEVLTLVDENCQEKNPGYLSSNYWNFKLVEDPEDGLAKFDLRIDLRVGFYFSRQNRGIGLTPMTSATLVSPADFLPNFRMFKALTDSDKTACTVAKEIASSYGVVWVTLTDLELGGIRTFSELFNEFACNNEEVKKIARRQEVFVPLPYNQQPGDELFIIESAQPGVFQAWRAQLAEYQKSLNLV